MLDCNRMTPSRAGGGSASVEPQQTPEQIAAALQEFLAEHPGAVVLEDGKVLFAMERAKYSLATAHGRCTLQIWDEERILVRRFSAAVERGAGPARSLRLTTHRFGQSRPGSLELLAGNDRRTPSTREAARTRYLRVLERVMSRQWGDWKPEGFRTAMDLERSFGPAYARGSLVHGQQAWAVIGVNDAETQALIDGILTLGVLWLAHCRDQSSGRRVYSGLKLLLPKGAGALTAARLSWMNPDAGQWELWELDEKTEELRQLDPADQGNLTTRLLQLPSEAATRERFAAELAQLMSLIPQPQHHLVEQRVRSGSEVTLLLHGLEFARVRAGYAGQSFNRVYEITVGAGANETPLTPENEPMLRDMLAQLFARRVAPANDAHGVGGHRVRASGGAETRDPLYRMQPERWLESVLRRDVQAIDERLDPAHVYTQVPAFAASDRGMLDLLGVDRDGRLAVLELKADEDLHLALQGLDYWIRVRWHHMQTADPSGSASGLGEFQRLGYFPGVRLSPEPPRLYLVAPALRIHPATETVLRYLSPRVEWQLVALDERWREKIRVVWRKRSGTL